MKYFSYNCIPSWSIRPNPEDRINRKPKDQILHHTKKNNNKWANNKNFKKKKWKSKKIHRKCSGRATENLKTVLESWWSGHQPSNKIFVSYQNFGSIQYDNVQKLTQCNILSLKGINHYLYTYLHCTLIHLTINVQLQPSM